MSMDKESFVFYINSQPHMMIEQSNTAKSKSKTNHYLNVLITVQYDKVCLKLKYAVKIKLHISMRMKYLLVSSSLHAMNSAGEELRR